MRQTNNPGKKEKTLETEKTNGEGGRKKSSRHKEDDRKGYILLLLVNSSALFVCGM